MKSLAYIALVLSVLMVAASVDAVPDLPAVKVARVKGGK